MAGPAVTSTGEQRKRGPKQNGQSDRRRAVTADSATAQDQCHPRKLFIGGLAHKTTTQQLRDYFQRYGSIVDAVVLRWPDGRSRGFGYVTYQDSAAVTAAVRTAHEVDGRQVDVKRAVPGTNKLFIGGLPQNTAATELREHFETFGVVSDAVVMIDPATGRSRGFGFVCFLPGQDGATAVQSALGQYQAHRIRGKWIEVKSAAPPHKLTGKDSEVGTPPGVFDTPSSQEAELAALAVPDFQLPPSTHQQEFSQKQKQKQRPGYEPQRIMTTATMEAGLSGMSAPPGLADPAKSKAQVKQAGVAGALVAGGYGNYGGNAVQMGYPNLMGGNSMFVSQAPWRQPGAGQAAPWPGCASHADPKVPGLVSSAASYGVAPDLPGALNDAGVAGSSLSNSLQKSLEQLLRQQSSRMEAEKVDTRASAKKGTEAECGSPSKVFCHGG